jgi:DNA gyrase subunit A
VLIPTDRPDLARPERLDLKQCLVYWLDFRFDTVRRRFEFDLQQLRERIHILEGFQKIFDALDEAIAIIRKSEGKRDAAERLIKRFELSDAQADAILELRLYKLARMEIHLIIEELETKLARAEEIEGILASTDALWLAVKQELLRLKEFYADKRRTRIGGPKVEVTYDADAYIVKEDAYVVVTRDGWIKRQSSFTTIDKIRVREGDTVDWLIRANTRSTVTFFTDLGGAYVMRVDDIPATTGHGEPLQRHFSFADGERVVGVASSDARNRPTQQEFLPLDEETPPPPYAMGMTRWGRALAFPLAAHEEPSTKNGRRYARLDEGDKVFGVRIFQGGERVCVASRQGRAMCFDVGELPILRAAGKGVTGIKLHEGDTLLAMALSLDPTRGVRVVTEQGKEYNVCEKEFKLSSRGAIGRVLLKRGVLTEWLDREPTIWVGPPDPAAADVEEA